MDQELCMRIADIRRRLDTAALERWGRVPEIIAVSKTVAAPRVNEIKASGILHLGENRVQEILEKLPYLDASFQIDLIGRLQIKIGRSTRLNSSHNRESRMPSSA